MANSLANGSPQPKFSVVIQTEAYKNLINRTLGDKEISRQFIADISTVVSNNPALSNCQPASILSAGLMAQTLKLSLAGTLGFAYVIPYGDKAQFQVGWKGFVQLAQRSGQFKRLGVREVHEGEHIGQDDFGEDLFKFDHKYDSNEVIGYFAYFELLNGFQKTMYWTKEQCEAHARKYSRSYGSGKSTDLWKNSFDQMACKTVLKLLLNRYAPLSVELQKAMLADQAVIKDVNQGTYEYVENGDAEDAEKVEKPSEAKEEKKKPATKSKAESMQKLEELAKEKKENVTIERNAKPESKTKTDSDIVNQFLSQEQSEKQEIVEEEVVGYIDDEIDEVEDNVEEEVEERSSYSGLGGLFGN